MGNKSSVTEELIASKTTQVTDKNVIANPDVKIVEKHLKIDDIFTNEVRNFMEYLKTEKNKLNSQKSITTKEKEKLFSTIDKHFIRVKSLINRTLHNSSLFSSYKKYYQSNILEFFLNFDLGKQAYTKPFGYPGDYKVISYYYQGTSKSLTFFDYLLDEYTIHHTSCGRGVRNRVPFMKSVLHDLVKENKNLKIISIASGPAEEAKQFINENKITNQISWEFLDLDKNALTYIKQNMNNNSNIALINDNIFKFINRKNTTKYDLIYSLGLFDYFNDSLFIKVMNKLKEMLSNNGTLIIGNLANHKHKTYMELIAEWELYYRSIYKLNMLAKKSYCANYSTITTQDKVQNYLIIKNH